MSALSIAHGLKCIRCIFMPVCASGLWRLLCIGSLALVLTAARAPRVPLALRALGFPSAGFAMWSCDGFTRRVWGSPLSWRRPLAPLLITSRSGSVSKGPIGPDGAWVPYLLASHSVRISVSRRLRDVTSRDRSRGRFHRAGVSRAGSWALAPLRLPRLSKRAGTKLDDSRVLQQGPFGTLDRTRSVLAQGLGRRPKV